MRPTLDYIKEKFDFYNKLCFDGTLPMPPISLNLRYGQMGVTSFRLEKNRDGKWHHTDLSIEISIRLDLPEEEYIDTLVHEMIHYYLAYNDIFDDSPHGTEFCRKMQSITEKHDIKITIAFDPSDEYLVNKISRIRYVCVLEFNDQRMGLAVVAKNKLFELWQLMPKVNGVRNVRWFVSNRAIFEQFPVCVSPGFCIVDADKVHHYLTGAKELQNDGKVIRVKD